MRWQEHSLDERWPLDDQPGPARRLPARQAQAMIQTALAAMDEPLAQTAPEVPRARGRRLAWLLAAALVVTAGAASAGIYSMLHEDAAPEPAPVHEPRPEPPAEPAPVQAPPVDELDREPPAPVANAEADTEADPEPSSEPALEADTGSKTEPPAEPRARRRRARRSRDRAAPARRDTSLQRQVARQPAPADTPPATPEDLMKQANEQRRARRWQAADALYQRVMDEHPGTSAAYVAAVAAASIRLDHLGNPRGALALYRRALRRGPDRALAEEARWGVAEAHRALGNTERERRALEELVRAHPGSPLVPRAEARLRALDPAETRP